MCIYGFCQNIIFLVRRDGDEFPAEASDLLHQPVPENQKFQQNNQWKTW